MQISIAKTLSIQFRMAVDLAIVNLHLFHVYEHKDRINITGIVLKAKQWVLKILNIAKESPVQGIKRTMHINAC